MDTDTSRGRIVTFGGYFCYPTVEGVSDQVHEFNGGQWIRMYPVGKTPTARAHPGLVFDSRRNVTVLFGGQGYDGRGLKDTWEYGLRLPMGTVDVKAGEHLDLSVSANGGDPTLTRIEVEGLPYGATFDSDTGHFSWTPTAEQSGLAFELTVRASSPTDSATDTLTLNVAALLAESNAPIPNPPQEATPGQPEEPSANIPEQNVAGESGGCQAAAPCSLVLLLGTGLFLRRRRP